MRAMVLNRSQSLDRVDEPLELVDVPTPRPEAGEVRVKITACGVCHTELDEIEGRLPPAFFPIILGHEIVGRIDDVGPGVEKRHIGRRVGVGWIHSSSGGWDENLSSQFRATGRDVHGGYAEFTTVPVAYAHSIPETFSDESAAPLLCAGAIGLRALKLTGIQDGERLGLTGFGGSAHLVLQLAQHLFPATEIFVFARDAQAREFALELGAVWSGGTHESSPEKLHAVIDTTPAWSPVVAALKNLRPGGRLVINAIRKEDADKDSLLALSYHDHLWMEREIKTVANITGHDIAEFLPLAAAIPLRPEVQTFALEDANQALIQLKRNTVRGTKVLVVR